MEPFDTSRSECKLRCGHALCNDCITRLSTPHCPLCRIPVWGGKPPEEDPGGPRSAGRRQPPAADDSRSRQIADDERRARELERRDRGGASAAADRRPARARQGSSGSQPSAVPLPFHFSSQRAMTYSNFDG